MWLTSDHVPKMVWCMAWKVDCGGLHVPDVKFLVVLKEVVENALVLFSQDSISSTEQLLNFGNAFADTDRRSVALNLCQAFLKIRGGSQVIRMGVRL